METTCNLIELLIWYRDLVKDKQREEANKLMHKACPKDLWWWIENSVNEDGKFIDIKNEEVKC